LLQILTLAAIFGILAATGWPVLYTPITLLLIVSAVMVLFTMVLALIQLARRRDATVTALGELAGPAVGALLSAYLVLAILGGGRFLLEGMLHIQPML
jgi:NADH:ubiquinone oxidoreductase subunit 6 (subunit J)